MTELLDLFQPRELEPATAVQAVIASNADAAGDDVYALIPSFDAQHRWGPLSGVADATQLHRGDDCLVVFDELGDPWYVSPAAGGGGEVGPQGPEGPAGPIGPAGATGPQGTTGAQGTAGAQGPVGPPGAQGTKGDTGATGPQGVQGNPGPTGPQGATGSGVTMKGSVATSANLPPTGNVQGDAWIVQADDSLWLWDGTQWVSGGSIQGPPGAQGIQGIQGPAGATGSQGPKGDPGATGSQGPTGAQGATGAQGPAGPSGASTFMSGSGAPSGAVGVDGAIYLDVTSLRLWGPKAGGAWPGVALGRLTPLAPTWRQVQAG